MKFIHKRSRGSRWEMRNSRTSAHPTTGAWLGFLILYNMLAYSLKSLPNLYVKCQKYCFIVCMRVLFVWISHLISWWFYIWLFLRCVFSGNSGIIILWCIFSIKSVRLVVHFAMVYLTMYINWRVCMTRCAMRKCCLFICIYVLFCYV